MYYEAKNVKRRESLIIIVFMCATTVLLWMLMIKLDKTENTKFETNYNASKVSTIHEENVEKQPENTIENEYNFYGEQEENEQENYNQIEENNQEQTQQNNPIKFDL